MILYHGTNCEFDKIQLEKSKNYRDFGKGFYTTTIEDQAREWAEVLFLRTRQGAAFLYEFETTDFTDLNVKTFSGYDLEWLTFVKDNRVACELSHSYDVVKGPVANDRTREVIAQYLSGAYDVEDTIKRLSYMKYNDQISFHTDRAIAKLNLLRVQKWNV